MLGQWREQIRNASEVKRGLQICGGGTKHFYGQICESDDEILNTKNHQGIISYEPTELVVTVKSGTSLSKLESILASEQQMLAFEPPHFGEEATVGGAVATGLSGPRRIKVGPLRDFVLGTKLLNGLGQELEFGGQVMKNVAGYDVSRLLAGSLGILGVITEVSLKVLPLPETELTLQFECNQTTALAKMRDWAAQSLPISATAWNQEKMWVRLSGATAAVKAAVTLLGGDELASDQAKTYWHELKEQQMAFFSDTDILLWRLALPASAPVIDRGIGRGKDNEDSYLEWNGLQRWIRTETKPEELRQQAIELGGHATLFRGGDKLTGVFTPLPKGLQQIHQNLKREFDPENVFNLGRMYPNL